MQGLNTGSFFDKHQSSMGGTKQSLGLMRPNTTTRQKTPDEGGKTAGGALMAGAGGAAGGAMAGAQIGSGFGGVGAAVGAAVGFAAYLMS